MAEREQDEDYIEINIPREEESVTQAPAKEEPKPKPKKKAAKKKAEKPVTPTRKTAKKPSSQKSESSGNWLWVVLLVIGLIVIAAVIYLSITDQNADRPKEEEQGEKRIAALVNGEPIYWGDIEDIYNSLPAQLQAQVDEEVIREQYIEQELLLQEAEKQGIEVTDEELDDYTAELLDAFGMTEEDLENSLALQGMTREEFDESNRNQLIVTELVNKTVYTKIIVTDEEIEARYEQDQELYAIPETATVRHILLTPEENETDEELEERAQAVLDLISDDFGNFCDLVEEHSQDPGSVATCGEYEVAQNGMFVPEFEDAAFDMDVNDTRLVESQFGQHVIWKVAHDEAGTRPIEDVWDSIEAAITQEKGSLEVRKYIDALRDDATIEKYPQEGAAVEETAPLTAEEEEEQDEEVQVEVEETKPVRQGNFGKCLSDMDAVLYGVSWAPDVKDQVLLLGEAYDEIEYVDCESDDAPSICDDLSVWPTWIIGGEDVLEGKQSLNALSRETGCEQN